MSMLNFGSNFSVKTESYYSVITCQEENTLLINMPLCSLLQSSPGIHEKRRCSPVEGLLLRHTNVPPVLPAVPLQPSVHVHLLHSGHEGEDCRHGLSLQEGEEIHHMHQLLLLDMM